MIAQDIKWKQNHHQKTPGRTPLAVPVTFWGRLGTTGWIQFWGWFKKTKMALENPLSSIVAAADYQALEADSPWCSLQQEELCS